MRHCRNVIMLGLISLVQASTTAQAGEAPYLAEPRCWTALDGVEFESPAGMLVKGTLPVCWSLFNAPPGMEVDPWDGVITWPDPREGRHVITSCATNAYGADYTEWVLIVAANDIAGAQIFSTQYVDFVVPGSIADWMDTWNAGAFIDGYWRRLRDVVGQEPFQGGRQIMKYAPEMDGAVSGNPAKAGPGWWSIDPVEGWSLGIWSHEVGHNFHAETRIGKLVIGYSWPDVFIHHGMELSVAAMIARAVENPLEYGLHGDARANFEAWAEALDAEYVERSEGYLAWLDAGGRAEGYVDVVGSDPYGVWGRMCRVLRDSYGPEILERTLWAVSVDGLTEDVYALADTPVERNTLLVSIMSSAAGDDLRTFFDDWGFDVDHGFYDEVYPAVSQAAAELSDVSVDGWQYCPLNGHYYNLTAWSTTWYEAERMARRHGGHLATVHSAEENSWLVNHFGRKGALWIGLTDQELDGLWEWTSGEMVDFTYWGYEEPNGGTWENHALLNWWYTGEWNDAHWESRHYGVMELSHLPGVPGDLDDDRDVDGDDLSRFIECLGGPTVCEAPAACVPDGFAHADIDADGDVDLVDIAGLQRAFTGRTGDLLKVGHP